MTYQKLARALTLLGLLVIPCFVLDAIVPTNSSCYEKYTKCSAKCQKPDELCLNQCNGDEDEMMTCKSKCVSKKTKCFAKKDRPHTKTPSQNNGPEGVT